MKVLKNRKIGFKFMLVLVSMFLLVNFCGNNVALSHYDTGSGQTFQEHGGKSTSNTVEGASIVYNDGCYVKDGVVYTSENNRYIEDKTSSPVAAGVQAQDTEWSTNKSSSNAVTGGKLIGPIVDLVLGLGDGVVDIIQRSIMGTESAVTFDIARKLVFVIISAIFAIFVVGLAVALVGPLVAALGPFLAAMAAGAAGVAKLVVAGVTFAISYQALAGGNLPDITLIPTYTISPEEIFQGKILLFDVNIFNPKEVYVEVVKGDNTASYKLTEWNATTTDDKGNETYSNDKRKEGYEIKYYYYLKDPNGNKSDDNNRITTSANNSAYELKGVISKWYYTVRNISIVVLMVVLLYVGIRIIISTVASEKAKYKQMLTDWVIGMCLVFMMQYIMVFANNFTESITNLLVSVSETDKHVIQVNDAPSKLREGLEKNGMEEFVHGNNIEVPTNLMGKVRMLAQEQNGTSSYVGYAICFLVLVIYTIVFTITYAKRLLYMMFLTIIAPLVAVSYPLDKMGDSKSQAFDMWLKEYIFNLLIQPFHLLLYTILISMAFDLAGTNIIYSLVAIGFMVPAEKLLRKMFGFDKASTPGFLQGATGTAMAMSAMHGLERLAGKGPGAKGPGAKKEIGNEENGDINFLDRSASHSMTDLFNDVANNGNDEPPEMPQNDNANIPDENNEDRQRLLTDNDDEGIDYNTNGNQHGDEQDQQIRMQENDNEPEPQLIDEQEQPEQEPEPERPLSIPRAMFNRYARTVKSGYKGKNFKRNLVNGMTGAARAGLKVSGVAAGGMIGAAAGIASGDIQGTLKNTVAGAYAGNSIGTGAGNFVTNKAKGIHKYAEEIEKERYGSNYSSHMKAKKDKEFKNDVDMRTMYKRQLNLETEEEVDRAMDDANKYRSYGVTDNDTIISAMTMLNGNETNRANSDRIAAAKLATISKNEKDLSTNIQRFAKTPGMSRSKVVNMERKVRIINKM